MVEQISWFIPASSVSGPKGSLLEDKEGCVKVGIHSSQGRRYCQTSDLQSHSCPRSFSLRTINNYDYTQPAVALCVWIHMEGGGGRLQKMSTSSSVTYHLTPPPKPPWSKSRKGQSLNWASQGVLVSPGVQQRGPTLCSTPSLSPSASWTQDLLFHSAVLSSPQVSLTASPASLLVGLLGPSWTFFPKSLPLCLLLSSIKHCRTKSEGWILKDKIWVLILGPPLPEHGLRQHVPVLDLRKWTHPKGCCEDQWDHPRRMFHAVLATEFSLNYKLTIWKRLHRKGSLTQKTRYRQDLPC